MVAVHCLGGINRSPLVMIYWFVYSQLVPIKSSVL
jgi:protein-tyrosine phosphatase